MVVRLLKNFGDFLNEEALLSGQLSLGRYCYQSCGICPVTKRFTSLGEVTEFALEIMRIIIELPRLNENHKSTANIVNKNVAQLTFTTARPLEHRDIVQVQQQSYKFVAIILIGIIY